MKLELVEKQYNFRFPEIFRNLWNDGMLDWNKGWNEPWTQERNWFTEIYPKIKDTPPLLLHTGGFDFQLLSEHEIIHYDFYEHWHPKHQFIPFAQTNAGDLFAFYKNIEIEGQHPIVLVWHDANRTEVLSKNFEDFIFRRMLERVANIEEDDIIDNFEGQIDLFQKKVLADLSTTKKYLNQEYIDILTEIFNRPFLTVETIISVKEMNSIFEKTIYFDQINIEFQHETEL
ncbi:SMI1/KNR4 family protein [Aquimarina aquimarini]|uniref:SMI1/KNR4 family protein n=1 Tax=Aquimarina aquimarini TaxID=1191734 RepID=UPI000D5559C9|nr:SMI1/KNR4 family protein [Aquimarina aquimarini]